MTAVTRRAQLVSDCTDYVLQHGLIGLTLRPLAAGVGTSDRMLIYHFGDRDRLLAAVLDESTDRSVNYLGSTQAPRSVKAGVLRLWQGYQELPLYACNLIYVQAAASGYLGKEPYRTAVRRANEHWATAMRDWFTRCGVQPGRVARVAALVDTALLGFHVDLATEPVNQLNTSVRDLGDAAQALALREVRRKHHYGDPDTSRR